MKSAIGMSWRSIFSAAVLAIALPISSHPLADESAAPPSPNVIKGAVKVDADGLISVVEKTETLVLIDSRKSQDRMLGYIEGSISLPDTQTDCKSLAQHIPAKTHPVLFYCNGPKCGRSAVAIKIALQCGYNNIYWFRGGIEEWMAKEYPLIKNK